MATSRWLASFEEPDDDELPLNTYALVSDSERYDLEEIRAYYESSSDLATYFLRGSEADTDGLTQWFQPRPNLVVAANLAEFTHVLLNTKMSDRDDICELCGGAARVSVLCSRRQLKDGGNFDLLTGFNLNTVSDQNCVWKYLEHRRPIVIVMAPTCTPYGPFSFLNYWNAHESWKKSYELAYPHARFCGEVALYQCQQRDKHCDWSSFVN